MHSYICLYIFLLFNLISFIFIFLSISFSYCSLQALKRIQKYTVYACISFSSFCLFPRLFSAFLTDGAQLWFDPVYPTWWEFSAFVLFTLTEKWIIFVVHILPQRHLRGVDSTRWWVFPLSNGSRGSCRRGPNGRGDVVGGRGQQRARICQRWTRSVVAVSASSTEGLYVWLWLRIMEKNGNSTDWDHSQRFGLDVDAPRPFDSATDVGIFWITVKLLESLSSRSEESHPGGLKSLRLQLKPSRG